jgi:hypothetical protein
MSAPSSAMMTRIVWVLTVGKPSDVRAVAPHR